LPPSSSAFGCPIIPLQGIGIRIDGRDELRSHCGAGRAHGSPGTRILDRRPLWAAGEHAITHEEALREWPRCLVGAQFL
jgi:hypothetical protein